MSRRKSTIVVESTPETSIAPVSLVDWAMSPEMRLAYLLPAPRDETPEQPAFVPEAGQFVTTPDSALAHSVLKLRSDRFVAECGRTYVLGGPAPASMAGTLCQYCADGTFAPSDAPDPRPRERRAQVVAEPTAEELAERQRRREQESRFAIQRALNGMYVGVNALNVNDGPDNFVRVLSETIRALKGAAPRQTGTGQSGERAPRATYDVTPERPGETRELAMIRRYANQGEARAQELIAHVDSWVDAEGKVVSTRDKLPGGVCSHCKSDKHLRRTGFFSATREIEKMAERASKTAQPANVTALPEQSSDTVEAAA